MMRRMVLSILACGLLAGLVAEAVAFGGPGRGPRPPQFSELDADGDGAVTEAEFEAHAQQRAREHFSRMDTNGDGVVTEEEMEAGRPRRGRGGGYPGGPPPN